MYSLSCSIPTLSDFGYPSSEALYTNSTWVGGETEALKRLTVYCNARKANRELSVSDQCQDLP
jgi:hypothetical protein